MPLLTVEGQEPVNVPAGKRLILALTEDAKADQLHACGGNAKCTTCRVQFLSGEPTKITAAEKALLAARGLNAMPGLRLSCQIACDEDMSVRVISRFTGSGRADPGKPAAPEIAPPPVWTER